MSSSSCMSVPAEEVVTCEEAGEEIVQCEEVAEVESCNDAFLDQLVDDTAGMQTVVNTLLVLFMLILGFLYAWAS